MFLEVLAFAEACGKLLEDMVLDVFILQAIHECLQVVFIEVLALSQGFWPGLRGQCGSIFSSFRQSTSVCKWCSLRSWRSARFLAKVCTDSAVNFFILQAIYSALPVVFIEVLALCKAFGKRFADITGDFFTLQVILRSVCKWCSLRSWRLMRLLASSARTSPSIFSSSFRQSTSVCQWCSLRSWGLPRLVASSLRTRSLMFSSFRQSTSVCQWCSIEVLRVCRGSWQAP